MSGKTICRRGEYDTDKYFRMRGRQQSRGDSELCLRRDQDWKLDPFANGEPTPNDKYLVVRAMIEAARAYYTINKGTTENAAITAANGVTNMFGYLTSEFLQTEKK
jgi:hypothetical protein